MPSKDVLFVEALEAPCTSGEPSPKGYNLWCSHQKGSWMTWDLSWPDQGKFSELGLACCHILGEKEDKGCVQCNDKMLNKSVPLGSTP